MRTLPLLLVVLLPTLAACNAEPGSDAVPCEILFGTPSANTGLDAHQCSPGCACDDLQFSPPSYTESDIEGLRAAELVDPPDLLDADPYDTPQDHPEQAELFCVVLSEAAGQYRLETHDSLDSIEQSGATLTHHGACGQCSSLQDLAVYIANPDLSDPVRECALLGIGGSAEDVTECLQELDFSAPCAQIWAFNSGNTRDQCLEVCLAALDEPYHLEDGSLNECLQCDEDMSGPVFKAVAGRTRRNSGLPTALCRPCASVAPVVHEYP